MGKGAEGIDPTCWVGVGFPPLLTTRETAQSRSGWRSPALLFQQPLCLFIPTQASRRFQEGPRLAFPPSLSRLTRKGEGSQLHLGALQMQPLTWTLSFPISSASFLPGVPAFPNLCRKPPGPGGSARVHLFLSPSLSHLALCFPSTFLPHPHPLLLPPSPRANFTTAPARTGEKIPGQQFVYRRPSLSCH